MDSNTKILKRILSGSSESKGQGEVGFHANGSDMFNNKVPVAISFKPLGSLL